ncbi:hypothetical protein J2741_000650 [Methanolinea mesophila]|uniref:hypothetical protein n=1 Tax=Methanolinea mesophila TaxID=547055 RepID=UPI001AE5B782|nr:hypothetical protein [Methanolinea mesophila]MBP1928103.1 hypothetical protein [Methanolinea mesophila]
MKHSRYALLLFFGFLSWLIPFLVSIPFYSVQGTLLVDVFLFKSIMIVVGSVVGTLLMVWLFLRIREGYLMEGILIGFTWPVINWVMDGLILLPMSGMDVSAYFAQIGIRYLVIPVISVSMGYVLEKSPGSGSASGSG